MIRNLRTIWLAAFAVTLVSALSQLSNAQPSESDGGSGPRGPGRFGPPRVRSGTGFGPGSALATIPEVQKALKLSADQKKQLRQINDEFRENFRNLLQAGGAREGVQQLNEDAKAKVAEVLDDDQEKRLRGITIQIMGATPDENQREKFEALREAHAQKLLEILTSPQRDQLKELHGETVKIDLMKLRGGGFGGRSRGGFASRGNRDRGDRERDSSNEETDSKDN